jgi:transcriptional regulator with XRE-family HTH domain
MVAKEVEYMAITIGSRIKARRQELKISQRELASRMGYTDHTTITRIEAGKVDPPQSRIAQFAKALGTTPGHLMGWDAEPEDLGAVAAQVLADPNLLQLVQTYQTLSDADRYALRLMADSLALKTKKD